MRGWDATALAAATLCIAVGLVGAVPPVELGRRFPVPPPPLPATPVGTILNGTCGPTHFGGDCNTEPRGAFAGVATLTECVAKVKSCKMGNFASFSNVPGNQDCSWYSVCDTSDLCVDCSKPSSSPSCPQAPGCPKYYPYQTEVVKAGPTPRPLPAVGTTGNGTCGPTVTGKDCNIDPKGSFPGMKTLASCVAKLKGCKMANFASWSLGWNDCSWYTACDWDHLCADCTKPGPSCPNPATGGCPVYHPFTSEILRKPGSPPAPPGPPPLPPPPPSPAPPAPAPAPRLNLTVTVDWDKSNIHNTAATSATVEVDVMPFLSHSGEGGPFDAYYTALSNLGAEYVRYSPWYPYPHVVVMELTPPDCTATKPATNWNSTLFDGIVRDFMEAVCGPDAVKGTCKHSVAQQLSTMPAWLYQGGSDINDCAKDPWQFKGFADYNHGTALKNESCADFAAYFARVVSHYTAGGHTDSCGHWHESGFYYNWTVVSVLNENEHNTGGPRYTRCFDAIRKNVEKINQYVKLAGPEVVGNQYVDYFLDPKNHDDKRPPEILSHHAFLGFGAGGTAGEQFFKSIDGFIEGNVKEMIQKRNEVAPLTELVLNEWIPFLNDWCDPDDAAALFAEHGDNLERDPRAEGCPSWQDPKSHPVRPNRQTLGWNAAAAAFAYGYGRLGMLGYKYVGADQLIGGTWPDNEPAVSCLDWKTGETNAKYWAVNMLAQAMGFGLKDFYNATISAGPAMPPPPVGTIGNGTCGATSFGGNCNIDPKGAWDASKLKIGSLAECVTKAKDCKMANYVSFSDVPGNQDCSWYSECDMSHLCEDCHTCGIGCPKYYPYKSEVLKDAPPPGPATSSDKLFAMPYAIRTSSQRGVLLVSKTANPLAITLHGSGLGNTTAQVLDGSVDGLTMDQEPGFVPPVERIIGGDGTLWLGPYGVALVDAGIVGR